MSQIWIESKCLKRKNSKVSFDCGWLLSKGKEKYLTEYLDDFEIPLLLIHKITELHGDERVDSVTVAEVDSEGRRIEGTEKIIECDTILLAVDLMPDTALLKDADIALTGDITTDLQGVFVCGNANHIHEDVDSIIEESQSAGLRAAKFVAG